MYNTREMSVKTLLAGARATYGGLVADFTSLSDSYDEVYEAFQEYEELQSIVEGLVDSPTHDGDARSLSRNRYWVSYTLDITSSGSGTIRLYWAVPQDTLYQDVVSVSYNEEVEHYQLDDHGNQVAARALIIGSSPRRQS